MTPKISVIPRATRNNTAACVMPSSKASMTSVEFMAVFRTGAESDSRQKDLIRVSFSMSIFKVFTHSGDLVPTGFVTSAPGYPVRPWMTGKG